MATFDFEDSLGYWICSASHAMRRALDHELSSEGITLRQWEVLAWLVIEGAQSQCQLADRMGIEAPTLAGIVSRMERDGWIDRTCCPDDRRKKRLHITDLADSVWNRTVECCRRVRARATQNLAPEDLLTFRRVCEQLRVNLAPIGDDAKSPCVEEVADHAPASQGL